MTKPSRQVVWQRKKLAAGLCAICGRLPLYTKRHCLKCAVANNNRRLKLTGVRE